MSDRRPSSQQETALSRELVLAFAPLDKAAFGAAIGVAAALFVGGMTVLTLLQDAEFSINLMPLAAFFRGYTVTWNGAVVGAVWAWFVGFVFGWFFAFCRNLVMAINLLVIRTRAEMAQTRDLLDHI